MHISLFIGLTKFKVRNTVLFYVCDIQIKYNPNRNHYPYHYVSGLFTFRNHALGNFQEVIYAYYFIYKIETTFEMNEAVFASTDGKQNA
jgi:hypothetical protein